MHRKQPTMNKLLSKKWDERLMDIHLKKLEAMKPLHENKAPQYFSHLSSKPKYHQLMEGNYIIVTL